MKNFILGMILVTSFATSAQELKPTQQIEYSRLIKLEAFELYVKRYSQSALVSSVCNGSKVLDAATQLWKILVTPVSQVMANVALEITLPVDPNSKCAKEMKRLEVLVQAHEYVKSPTENVNVALMESIEDSIGEDKETYLEPGLTSLIQKDKSITVKD